MHTHVAIERIGQIEHLVAEVAFVRSIAFGLGARFHLGLLGREVCANGGGRGEWGRLREKNKRRNFIAITN